MARLEDELPQIAADTLISAIRMEDQTLPSDTNLVPLDQVTDDLIEPADLPFFERREERVGLDPKLLIFGKLTLKTYAQYLEYIRNLIVGDRPRLVRHEQHGRHAKLIGKMQIFPLAPQGRYTFNFLTTNIENAEDWSINSSTFMGDLTPSNLDSPAPISLSRQEDWIVGHQPDSEYQVIGVYRELFNQSAGQLTAYLQSQGYQNPGHIWGAFIHNHAGWFTPQPS